MSRKEKFFMAIVCVSVGAAIVAFNSYEKMEKKAARENMKSVEKNKKIKECHDGVHEKAKNYAEILSTDIDESEDNSTLVEGYVRFQNGFGGWGRYRYNCHFDNIYYNVEITVRKG